MTIKPTPLGLAALIAATVTQSGYAQTNLTRASGGDRTDFALFDGTDPTALEGGVACGAQKGGGEAVPFTYFVTVSNWSGTVQVIRVRYNDNKEIARLPDPARQLLQLQPGRRRHDGRGRRHPGRGGEDRSAFGARGQHELDDQWGPRIRSPSWEARTSA